MKQQPNILIYEPNESLGSMIKEFLQLENFPASLFSDTSNLYQASRSLEYVLCIISLIDNTDAGLLIAEKLKTDHQDMAIVFLGNHPTKDIIVKAYELGADDFIRAPFSMEELHFRCKAILRRTHQVKGGQTENTVFKIGDYFFDTNKQTLSIHDSSHKLTTKEAELLLLLCNNANSLIERERVLQVIWKSNTYFNARSMDVYITKLRKLLKHDTSVGIINIHGKGYKLATNQ